MSSNTRAGRRKSPPATSLIPKRSAPATRSVSAASSTASTESGREFVGIDVGGERKGFHACALVGRDVVAGPLRLPDVTSARAWVAERDPELIGIDSPRDCAAAGESSRPGERLLAREGPCRICWTPAPERLTGPYYGWVRHGLELYAALAGWNTVEVFPTAAWTVWSGPRGGRGRAEWSASALAGLGLSGLPPRRLSQDDRDAVAAALTARLHDENRTRCFGPIVVPADGIL